MLKDDLEEVLEIVGIFDRVLDVEVFCFEIENVILLDDGGGKEVDVEDDLMFFLELFINF